MGQQAPDIDWQQLASQIKQWALELGFAQAGICDTDLQPEEAKLQQWLDLGMHGDMSYMAEHGMMRARPAELLPGTLRVISVRMNYLPPAAAFATNLADPALGIYQPLCAGPGLSQINPQPVKTARRTDRATARRLWLPAFCRFCASAGTTVSRQSGFRLGRQT